MPARKATLEYRVEHQPAEGGDWVGTTRHHDSLEAAQDELRRSSQATHWRFRIVQRKVQAGDWVEPGADE